MCNKIRYRTALTSLRQIKVMWLAPTLPKDTFNCCGIQSITSTAVRLGRLAVSSDVCVKKVVNSFQCILLRRLVWANYKMQMLFSNRLHRTVAHFKWIRGKCALRKNWIHFGLSPKYLMMNWEHVKCAILKSLETKTLHLSSTVGMSLLMVHFNVLNQPIAFSESRYCMV